MQQYKDLVKDIIENGTPSDDRTGTGTRSLFGRQLKFNLQEGFPIVTLKKTFWKGVLLELLWILQGSTNIKFLNDHRVKIWDKWADENGDLGPVYGAQLRNFTGKLTNDDQMFPDKMETIDQLALVIDQIKNNPNSRRILYTLWNPAEIEDMALPPCVGIVTQFYVRDGKLSCQTYQRSADTFLGVPFDIASYACLTHLIAAECGLEVGDLVYTFGDVHIYNNHIKQCEEMLKREPKELPKLTVNLSMGLLDFIDRTKYMEWTDIQSHVCLTGYDPHPGIKAEVSV